MRNTLLICAICTLGLLIGCEKETEQENDAEVEELVKLSLREAAHEHVEIVVIDGCEYILYKETGNQNQGYGFMAHKGNCKNPIHVHNRVDTLKSEPQE